MAQYIAVRALNRSAQIRLIQAVNEVQSITVDATSGNFTLTYSGQTTANIAFNASAASGGASVQTRLEALSNIAPGDIAVTGGPGNSGGTTPYFVSFVGSTLGDANVAQITGTDVTLAGGGDTITTATVTGGETGGHKIKLTPTVDVIVDLDVPHNRRELARHSAYGQYIVTAANADVGGDALPANS